MIYPKDFTDEVKRLHPDHDLNAQMTLYEFQTFLNKLVNSLPLSIIPIYPNIETKILFITLTIVFHHTPYICTILQTKIHKKPFVPPLWFKISIIFSPS